MVPSGARDMAARVILAYSGGLDTSVAIRWLIEKYDVEVITLTVNLGGSKNIDGVKARALQSGATKSFVIDHPTKPDKKLQYASLEGPEHSVYLRGRSHWK